MGRRRRAGELGIALGVIGLALFFAVGTLAIPITPTYARIGPRVFPLLVAIGLLLTGAVLVREAWRADRPGEPELGPDAAAFLWVSVGLFVHLLLVKPAGFVIASALLFACVARGFGSRRWGRDMAIALVLSVVAFVGFTRGLDLALPSGLLAGLL